MANTLDKVAETLQGWSDTLNSYNSILVPFKGYTKIIKTAMELEDLGGSILPDVVETVTNGVTSFSNIAGAEECMTGLRDMVDLIQL